MFKCTLRYNVEKEVEGSSKIQYRLEQQQQQVWNPPRTSNLEHHSPSSLMDDIERELKAEASLMDQMSSCDSSSDSQSSSSSSSEDSSSDSEDEDRASPSGPGTYSPGHPSMSARPQARTNANCHGFPDNSTLLMSTLRNDLQLSESESGIDN
ncbi:ELL-associated factor 2 [Onychomys torridus]|uniref:ELL-associated factor 2 n=1 Tax=Onychomys torridus TaxID=38674 RepID=UPI00167F7860|nr:ELL-associated factor 2 [Onychomys torridus]